MRIEDWSAVVARLKKRWDFLHEELALAAVLKALAFSPSFDDGGAVQGESSYNP
jgi:hypothetical protein